MAKKIILKAKKKDVPETIMQGEYRADLKDGYYETDHRAFADFIISEGYGEEMEHKDSTATPQAAPEKTGGNK